jgi:isopropylmalate/homocitrate/citramalate synthase
MSIYPKCAASFMEIVKSDNFLLNKFIGKIIKVTPFDVTLRDGLQSLSPLEQEKFDINVKKQIYNQIVNKYNPTNLEIGSCVNKKILPIFNNTSELFNYVELNNQLKNHYVLVPNTEQLINAINIGVRNFSFITSVSNSFQYKNTRMNLNQTYSNLIMMINHLNDLPIENYKVKLYVSCINECPIDGKIHIPDILTELFTLNLLNFDRICLSDTCGSLTNNEFINIIEDIKKIGIDTKKISLHLHVKPEREDEIERIFHTAIDYGIDEFDVSDLKTGGCSVTMDKDKMAPNLSYEQYYKFLTTYLLNKS